MRARGPRLSRLLVTWCLLLLAGCAAPHGDPMPGAPVHCRNTVGVFQCRGGYRHPFKPYVPPAPKKKKPFFIRFPV